MTLNEEKLEESKKWYKFLKVIGEATPLITTIMLAVILALQLAALSYIYLIMTSEKQQDLTREGIIKYRQDRIETENKILENQHQIMLSQDSVKNLLRGK